MRLNLQRKQNCKCFYSKITAINLKYISVMGEMKETASKSKYWLYFIISTAVMIALLIFIPEWFWLALPFSLTYLAAAMDVM